MAAKCDFPDRFRFLLARFAAAIPTMVRLMIADGQTIMREGLKRILHGISDISVVGEAADGDETLARVRKGGFDQLLLDLSMPGRNGVDLIRQIRLESPKLPILVLTVHDEEQYAVRTIRAGAQGYLTKQSTALQLINAILKVASGRPYITPAVAEQLVMNMMAPDDSAPHKRLSDREFEIFTMLAIGKSITEIADPLHLSAKTISTHKTNILKKMGMKTMSDMIQYSVRNNLIGQTSDSL